jgi:protein involved in polysaccharide export with SLBB domain
LLLALLSGCAADRSQFEQALVADGRPPSEPSTDGANYVVHCPDVVEFQIVGRDDWSGPRRVAADGRAALDGTAAVRADGRTPAEIARAAAQQLGLSAGQVNVRVAEFNSQQVYVFGEVVGLQRAVPYRGEETALELLRRVGGVTPGAAVGDVQVVRAHVADGQPPEVFPVDLEAIVLRHDQRTNVRLAPFDQVFVGQSSKSHLKGCFPPWLRPFYDAACGLRRRPSL